jgi:calcium-dependent protein kinase
MGQAISEEECNDIIRSVDADGNGYIEFNEFIIAAMNKNQLYSKENLTRAFKLFDRDGSNTISVQEIKD